MSTVHRTAVVVCFLFAVCASAATFTVTSIADSGTGSLRQAMLDANAAAGLDTINFSIGSGARSIRPATELPYITSPVILDGTTQPGYAGVPLIELDGNLAATANNPGLWLLAGNSTVRGLVLNRWSRTSSGFGSISAIKLDGNGGNTIAGNYIGTDSTGQTVSRNEIGVQIANGSSNNVIGGPSGRNVISGNGTGIKFDYYPQARPSGNIIRNNWIGLSGDGTFAVSNFYAFDVNSADGTIIGGSGANQGNVISGNSLAMSILSCTATTIQGNRFGTTGSGGGIVTNGIGIAIGRGTGYTIGGTTPGAGNSFTATNSSAITISDSGNNVIQGNTFTTNGSAIYIYSVNVPNGSDNNIVGGTADGAGNTIRMTGANPLSGAININNAKGCSVLRNSISGSYSLGIDLGGNGVSPNDAGDGDGGPNNLQNFPVLSSVSSVGGTTTIKGTLNSTANQTFRLEFFSNGACDSSGYGEGENYLGSADATTNASGLAVFNVTFPASLAVGTPVTATATDPNGNTSEFSACAQAGGAGVFSFNGSISGMPESVQPASLQVVRNNGSVGTVTVNYTTQDGTAKAPGDYIAQSGTLTFGEGETSKNINVTIVNDTIFEGSESFSVALSNPTGGATLGSQITASVTINDDDTAPSLSIADATMNEGNSGTTNMLFPVTLSAVSPATTTVYYYTSGGTAYSSEDYQYTSSTLTFNPGETQKNIVVPIVGDTRYEPDETFYVYIYGATNAAIARSAAIGTIVNDDVRPAITITDVSMAEGDSGQTDAVVTVTSNQPLYGELDYTTADLTARAGTDYVASYGYLYFYGETTRTFRIPVIGDTDPEPDESFTVRISYNSTGGIVDHSPIQVRILNDDAGFGPKAQKVALGADADFTLDLGVVPAAPFTLTLTSSNQSVLDPAPVTISQRATPVKIPAKTVGSATITATLPAPYSKTFTAVASVYEPANLVMKPGSLLIPEGTSGDISASFEPPLKNASLVQLRSANKAIFETPVSIVIEPGKTTVFTVKALKKGSSALITTLGPDHGDVQSTVFVDVTEAVKTPLITQITPANGPVAGGTIVTVGGANLAATCTMFFGGAPATNVAFVSGASMTATTPAHPAGAVDVLLSCGTDSFNFANGFTYLASSPIITGVTPSFGSTAGGTLVRLSGNNFRSGCWPLFDGVAARSASFVSATEVIGEVPAHPAGKVTVSLRCSGGQDGTFANGFTYSTGEEPAPLINSVTPLAASPGQAVTITGARFRSDDTVKFDGLAAAILTSSPDKDVVRVPDLPAGDAAITLTDNAGHSTTTGPIFTVLEPEPPRITSATPSTGRPGTDLVLDGSGFRPGYTFAFGTARAAVVSLSYTRVLLRVPDITPGAYPLNVLNAAGKIASIGPSVTVAATGPSIGNIMPACATTDGGGTMIIKGTGFEPGTTVTFNGIVATVRVIDAKTLSIVIPAGAAGSPRIMINNPGGTSASLTGAFMYFSPFDPNGGCSGGRPRPLRH